MVDFPAGLDSLTNPSSSDKLNNPSHSTQHQNANDAIEAIEAKVGVDGSAVTTSHDYKLGEVTGTDKAVGKSATQTLTNKTLTSPTLTTPTIASFVNATHDHSNSTNGGSALNSPTITTPKIITSLYDTNGNELLKVTATGSAVNELTLANAATGNAPTVSATGSDTNIDIKVSPKGSGNIEFTNRFDSWVTGHPVPTAVAYNGNRSYSLTYASSVLGFKSPGMRNRYTRSVTAPIQCADLEASSSQYFSKSSPAGMTWTDDFAGGAWVKLESYIANATIDSRYNGTSGWALQLDSSGAGQIKLSGFNAGGANFSQIQSYQSIPLSKWVHVVAQLDMSAFTATTTTSYVMIDGVDVPAAVSRGGTNPTALIQAGDYEIGANNGATNPFDGKLSQVFVTSAKLTQANAKLIYSQGITTADTTTYSMASAHSLSNSLTDLNTTNANNLTANNSAATTNTDSPFSGGDSLFYTDGTTDFSITTAVSSDGLTETVQVPEGYTIPTSGGIASEAYATSGIPYGFPSDDGKWRIAYYGKATLTQTSPVANTWYNLTSTSGVTGGLILSVPIGAWRIGYSFFATPSGGVNGTGQWATISTANNTEVDSETTTRCYTAQNTTIGHLLAAEVPYNLTSQTNYYLNSRTDLASQSSITVNVTQTLIFYADCAYL